MIQFVEFNDPVCRKKFYKLDHIGPVSRIVQPGIPQTGPISQELTANLGAKNDVNCDASVFLVIYRLRERETTLY